MPTAIYNVKFVKLKELTLLAKAHDLVVKSQPSSTLKEDPHKKGESQYFGGYNGSFECLCEMLV